MDRSVQSLKTLLLMLRNQAAGLPYSFLIASGLGVASPFLAKLLQLISDCGVAILTATGEGVIGYISSEISLVQGTEAEIERLQRTVEHISCFLRDADQRRVIVDDGIKQWLRQLDHLVVDAVDVIEEYQSLHNMAQIDAEIRRRSISSSSTISWSKRRKIASEIVEIRKNLDSVRRVRNDIQLESNRQVPSWEQSTPPTVAAVDERRLFLGREEEVTRILNLLKQVEAGDPSVICLAGMGGIGKTSLVKHIFNNGSTQRRFKIKAWVCLPEGFSAEMALTMIVEEMTATNCELRTLNRLHQRLRDLVNRKKFLLVLDNLQLDRSDIWESIMLPLLAGAKGSKILVTTRHQNLFNLLEAKSCIELQGLDETHCRQLFGERAFGAATDQADTDRVEIGKEIIRRCSGSPLAACVLGSLLRNRYIADWRFVLNDLVQLNAEDNIDNQLLMTLKLSYDRLPYHLKRCFSYCSIFPSDYEFDKDELVKLWMAERFIESCGARPLESIGNDYFMDLFRRSFFETCDAGLEGKQKYKMPGLINDLARSVSRQECLRIGCDSPEHRNSSSDTRYALWSYQHPDSASSRVLYSQNGLRTFILRTQAHTSFDPKRICEKFERLHVLDLRNSNLEKLPTSIFDRVNLRYLGLRGTKIKCLPESVSNLYNLQTLDLDECYELRDLPSGISNLVNLRHLSSHIDWSKQANWTDFNSMPHGIGDLRFLQTLSRFSVSSNDSGQELEQLKKLKLRGELCISKLENVKNVDCTREANLKEMEDIDTLMLRWSANGEDQSINRGILQRLGWVRHTSPDEQSRSNAKLVLEQLQPHSNLKHLRIQNYPGNDFPDWIGGNSLNFKSLILSNCQYCTVLPQLTQVNGLKKLWVEGMNSLKIVDCSHLPAQLKELKLIKCQNLVSLSQLTQVNGLKKLWLEGMDSLKIADSSHLPAQLEELKVIKCQHLDSLQLPII